MSKFVAGQEVEVFYEGRAGVKLWLNAKIKAVHIDHIRVEYYDKIPNYKDSYSYITRDQNIAAKLRPKQQAAKLTLVTSQFKIDDLISFKSKEKWVPAKVTYVGAGSKFIRVEYINDKGIEDSEQVNECEYGDKIRIISSNGLGYPSLECKDNKRHDNESQNSQSAEAGNVKMDTDTDGTNDADGNESDEVGLDSTPPQAASVVGTSPEYKAPETNATEPMAIDSNTETTDSGKAGGKSNNWNPLKTVYNYVTGSGGKDQDKPQPKKKRTWDQKAINDWSHQDVISWINSLKSAHKYCPENFPLTIDGNELLKTEESDLILIIESSTFRKLFMKHLVKAKAKYETAAELDEEEYENDDYKETSGTSRNKGGAVNGIVGLRNQGNTCYMNTSIQILSQSPYITRYLAKRAKLKNNSYYPMLNGWTSLCDVIYNQSSRSGYYTTIKPTEIRDALKRVDPDFGSGAQDDSARSLGYMLQELDKEIDQEINHTDTKSRSSIELQPGAALSASDIDEYVSRLREEHNPPQISSVLKKAFDGIEHITCECLECNQVYQNFSIFRVIDLPVTSNQVTLSNIHVVCNDKYYSKPKFPEISALGHCSVDVLRCHAIEYLAQFMSKSIGEYYCDIVCVSANGVLNDISGDRISDLKNMDGTIFVLINTKKASKKSKNYMLQLCLGVNEDRKTTHVLKTKAGNVCISYQKYDQNSICKLVQQQKASYDKLLEDDQKCDYYINYNDNIFSMEELKMYGVDPNMHNDGINKLLLLRVTAKAGQCSYDINNINEKLLGEAEDEYSTCSSLQALNKYRNKKIQNKKNHKKKSRYERIKEEVESELSAIEQTIEVLKAKQYIKDITSKCLTAKSRFTASSHGLLRTLTECINEYQRPQILDESAYAHPCPCKSGSGNSDWVKYQKKIVYSPPIFLFHLDRYGKNMSDNYTSSRSASSGSYRKGDSVSVKYSNGTFYKASIVQMKSNKMKIRYTDGEEKWVQKYKYSSDVRRVSSSSYRGYGGDYNYGGNKYSHGINYNLALQCDKRYNLYGVSNHSGSTRGGHYSATIQCLTDGKWYDVSDSNVSNAYSNSAISHSQSATILAYVRNQE